MKQRIEFFAAVAAAVVFGRYTFKWFGPVAIAYWAMALLVFMIAGITISTVIARSEAKREAESLRKTLLDALERKNDPQHGERDPNRF